MMPDEVRMLDNQYALLFIRGERPVLDHKYDVLQHPNVGQTTDGGQPPFEHGTDQLSIASITLDPALMVDAEEFEAGKHYEILTDEEIERLIEHLEEKQNENQSSKH